MGSLLTPDSLDLDNVQKKLSQLADEHRGSSLPVSAFFLVTCQESIDHLVQRLRALSDFGVTSEQINSVAQAVKGALECHGAAADYLKQCELQFQIGDEFRKGYFCYIRNMPGKGIEVEIALPGIIASKAPGFVDNDSGFWTAFLPPSFYR